MDEVGLPLNIIEQSHLCIISRMLWVVIFSKSKIILLTHLSCICMGIIFWNVDIHLMIHNALEIMKFSYSCRTYAKLDEHFSTSMLDSWSYVLYIHFCIFLPINHPSTVGSNNVKLIFISSTFFSDNRVLINILFYKLKPFLSVDF